jgi:hypothetical protein
MLKKLGEYSLLSLISFCIFTAFFQSVVHAQGPIALIISPPPNTLTPTILIPTPTVFLKPTATPTIPLPTPTVFFMPTDAPTPFPAFAPTAVPQAAIIIASDLESLFSKYADMYHADKEQLKRVARCESNFNNGATNGIYLGMFQFAAQTWINNRIVLGLDTNPDLRMNAEEAIRTAAFMFGHGHASAWGCK